MPLLVGMAQNQDSIWDGNTVETLKMIYFIIFNKNNDLINIYLINFSLIAGFKSTFELSKIY